MNATAMLLAVFAASVSFAGPSVSNVIVSQDVDSLAVTIGYSLSGAPAVVTVDVQTNVVVRGEEKWISIGGEHLRDFTPESDVFRKVTADGDHTMVWQPDSAELDALISQNGARVVVNAWAMDNTPDYLVIDLSQKNGLREYYPSESYLPQGVLGNARYRTTCLVMRRMHARNVPWMMGSFMESESLGCHTVAMLTNDYYIGVFPLTQAQWFWAGSTDKSFFNNVGAREMRPVNNVSMANIRTAGSSDYEWPKAPAGFIKNLRERTGIGDFDLPTEGEWEFAARAGGAIAQGVYNTGKRYLTDSSTDSSGNIAKDANLPGRYAGNGGDRSVSYDTYKTVDETHGTAIVGSYEPNAYGLYDMHGNVWEWCLDYWCANSEVASYHGLMCTKKSSKWVLKGGAYNSHAPTARLGNRLDSNEQSPSYGLRVACRAGLK